MSKEADSGPKAEELPVDDQSTQELSPIESAELQELMQPDASSESAGRLNDEAREAAEQAVVAEKSSQGGHAEEVFESENDPLPEEDAQPSWILRGLLILNLVLMGVMLALPSADSAKQPVEHQPDPLAMDPTTSARDPFISPEPKQVAIFREPWNRALQLADQGDFNAAVSLLAKYIEAEGAHEPDFIRSQVYRNLSRYSYRLGRFDDAAKYESQAEALVSYSKLPMQLIREAKEAEAKGDGRLMRQAYARLLLIQSQVPRTEQNRIIEAYLKLADSFRIDATRSREEGK